MEEKLIITNISTGKKYLTQRDNKIDPAITCNTTSMCMMLTYSGITLPAKKDEEQYEDLLTKFLRTDQRVLDYYKSIDPAGFKAWQANPHSKSVTPPNENHACLSYGTNLWVGKDVTKFSTTRSMTDILSDLIKNKASVCSGLWCGFHHITCIVGFTTFQEDLTKTIDLTKVKSIIIDDPYGDYRTKYTSINGNDIEVPWKDFLANTRTFNQVTNKWVHYMLEV